MVNKNMVKIIIADDQYNMRLLMKRIVLPLNYMIVGEAANGGAVLDLYEKEQPDILLLDIEMPVKNGVKVLEEVLEKDPEACVIMMTSVADSDIVRQCLKLGAVNYILKTTPVKDIRQRIKETYEKHRLKKSPSDK